MSFKNNCTKIFLLTNQPITFFDDEKNISFQMRVPTIEDFYFNNDFLLLVSLFEKDLKEIQTLIPNYTALSHYDFMQSIFLLSTRFQECATLCKSLYNGFKVLFPEFRFNNVFYVNNDVILRPELLDDVIEVIFLSLDKETIRLKSTDDEFTKMEKQAKLRAQQIRANARKNDNQDATNIEDIMIAILYEFQQYKLEDL